MPETATCDRLIEGQQCQIERDAKRLSITLTDMPPSRHNWGDIIRCPNDGCEREFLVRRDA